MFRQILDEQSRLSERIGDEVQALDRTLADKPLLQKLREREDVDWDELLGAAGC